MSKPTTERKNEQTKKRKRIEERNHERKYETTNETTKEIKTEILDEFLPIFTEEVMGLTKEIEGEKEEIDKKEKNIKLKEGKNKDKKINKVIEDELLPKETIVKIKKLFREIVKKTHPDKVNSEDLIEIYINAKDAYESNDILKLAYYANNLGIEVELSDLEIDLLKDLISFKK